MQLARFFQKLQAFEFDCVETTQSLAISIHFEHLQNRVNSCVNAFTTKKILVITSAISFPKKPDTSVWQEVFQENSV